MSAIRERIIKTCGTWAARTKLIDRGIVQLPEWWPGDDVGKDTIFPDEDTAGRQIYRLGYTIVSFVTLGRALSSYLVLREHIVMPIVPLPQEEYMLYFGIASASGATSISSLFNASPLSLMPGFQATADLNDGGENGARGIAPSSSSSIAGLQRNDALKFEPRGLTRITRHPLILPVVPWGITTSYLVGGQPPDFLFFGGLAAYAIAGCACQDLRIAKKEGSVGTVFRPSDVGGESVGGRLETFFSATSFVPFAAVLDGRQSLGLIVKEFPLLPYVLSAPLSALIEYRLLQWL